MKPFIEQARAYAAYHQDNITRYTHMVGIPLILLSLMILLGLVHLVIPGVLDLTLAELATLALLIFYFRLQWRLALAITPILIILLWIAEFFSYEGPNAFSLWSFIIILLIGCAFQATGHFFEGKRPAFVDNVWQTFLAPLFLIAEVFFMAGRMDALHDAIHEKKHEKKRGAPKSES